MYTSALKTPISMIYIKFENTKYKNMKFYLSSKILSTAIFINLASVINFEVGLAVINKCSCLSRSLSTLGINCLVWGKPGTKATTAALM